MALDPLPSTVANARTEKSFMKLPLGVAVKNFFGLYVPTPFEQHLLEQLKEALAREDRETLSFQLARFTTTRRLTRHLDVPNAHGFTNFHTLRFGKDVSAERQNKRFPSNEPHAVLATALVVLDGGTIEVKFVLVRGVLFRIEYRSPQKIYYPPADYRLESMSVWPGGRPS
jgi:hypothetical protein